MDREPARQHLDGVQRRDDLNADYKELSSGDGFMPATLLHGVVEAAHEQAREGERLEGLLGVERLEQFV